MDVFFVISGFLITGLLHREWRRSGRIDFPAFYARRARRLLPASILVVLVTFGWGWLVLPQSERARLAQDALGSALYVVNWVLADRSVDYLAEDASASALQHYWSLAVEEQFYLLWPPILVVGLMFTVGRGERRRRLALPILIALSVASLTWSLLLTSTDPARAYFVTTTRLWELGVGALLVFISPRFAALGRRGREALATLGLLAILVSLVAVDGSTPWPGFASLLPVLGTAAVIASGIGATTVVGRRLLSSAPLVWIGGLSYAIYLWHWPVITLAHAQFGLPAPSTKLALGVASVALAWVTKLVIEDPVRFHPRLATSPRGTLGLAAAAMAVCVAVVLTTWTTQPDTESAIDSELPAVITSPGAPDTRQRVSIGPGTLVDDLAAPTWTLRDDPEAAYTKSGPIAPEPAYAADDVPALYRDGCQVRKGDAEPRQDCLYGSLESTTDVLLLGDSKAGQWLSALDAVSVDEDWRLRLYTKSACPLTTKGSGEADCDAFGNAVVSAIEDDEQRPALAFVSTGAASTPELSRGLTEALVRLHEQGIEVIVLRDNPTPPGSRYPCAEENPDHLDRCSFEPRAPGGDDLLLAVADHLDLPVIDLNDWICPPGARCPVAIGERLIWRQGSHLTDTYVRTLTPFLYRELSRLGLAARAVEDIGIDDVPARHGDRR